MSRLPEVEGDKPKRFRFTTDPPGYSYVDLGEVQTAGVRLHISVAIDRTTEFAFVNA